MVAKLEWKEENGEKWFKFNKKLNEWKFVYGNILTVIFILVLITLGVKLYSLVMGHIDLLRTDPCLLCEGLGFNCFTSPFG